MIGITIAAFGGVLIGLGIAGSHLMPKIRRDFRRMYLSQNPDEKRAILAKWGVL